MFSYQLHDVKTRAVWERVLVFLLILHVPVIGEFLEEAKAAQDTPTALLYMLAMTAHVASILLNFTQAVLPHLHRSRR